MIDLLERFKEQQRDLKSTLPESQLIFLHYRSIDNFLYHFNEIKSELVKRKILEYLEKYFVEIKEKDYFFDNTESNYISQKYIKNIGTYYNYDLNFKVYIPIKRAIFIGLNIDIILFLTGLLKKVYYLPICTIFFTIYFLYLLLFYGKQKKLYGFKY